MTPLPRTYSAWTLGFLWFGAAVSISEIYTGGSLAAAPFNTALLALFSGHAVGAMILALIAYIGFKEQRPSLVCSRISFGVFGSWLLSVINLLQLVGWTTVMIQQSGQALGTLGLHFFAHDYTGSSIIIMGALVGIWTLWQIQGRYNWNVLSVLLMIVLCLVMTVTLFKNTDIRLLSAVSETSNTTPMSFQLAFTLSLVMPLSWAPLMADYTCRARNLSAAIIAPALGYTVGSVWMYGLGLFGSLSTGSFDPSTMLLALGLGIVALGVIVLSTVTTAFLDVYSAIASTQNIAPRLSPLLIGLIVVLLGTVLALGIDHNLYINFLLAIGIVFVPMMLILIMDYFVFHVRSEHTAVDYLALVSLSIGIISHLVITEFESSLSLPPAPLSAALITIGVHSLLRLGGKRLRG